MMVYSMTLPVIILISEPLLGPELDKPVFMISAIMEMSAEPMLPVYNLRVSSGFNPR